MLALNSMRVMEPRSIQCDKGSVSRTSKWFKSLIFNELVNLHIKCRIDQLAINSVQLLSDMIVGRQATHAENGLTGVLVERFMEFSLMVEKGRTLYEEYGKCRHADVNEIVLGV